MEEDIFILEKWFLEKAKIEIKENGATIEYIKFVKALENLLTRYKRLEEENKKLKTIKGFEEENIEVSKFGEWVGKDYIDYKFEYENYQRILADSIPKSKVKEKIEEYKKVIEITKEQLKHEENVDVRKRLTTTIEQATAGILALEGLLREE